MLTTNHNLLFKAIVLALCVISFVHVFLFPLYDLGASKANLKTYQDFEQSLCISNLRHQRVLKKSACPQYGIVTIVQGGRLGNQMWEYASVWALARRTGLEPYVPRCIRAKLDQIFESLSVPTFEEISHCTVPLSKFVRSSEAWNSTNQSIILPRYSIQPELVLTWVQDIIQEFSFKKKFSDKSQQILMQAAKNSTREHVFVGVHVRRTDYIGYLRRKHSVDAANASFYRLAMNYFEEKYIYVMFVMVSDDPTWCAKNFAWKKNLYITNQHHKNSPALDLAVLGACNHSIIDYGTFGEWGALLAGGETIFYNLTHHSTNKLGQILHNWHTI
ncbi:unnamed protein product [Brassicogethes aeneus]|uniref:L-Fucosyltransferase n=1 Tax=Brassicogethes aeneus TaxID=1431903 RepID=A0A9P0BDF5_BRAAE|nr:unnamed protein product [Brassicogethes aeneus]